MKKSKKWLATLLLTATCLGLVACGSGEEGLLPNGSINIAVPANVSVKTGSLATDSWGYTGSNPAQVAAPDNIEVVLTGRTLLMDGSRVVVAGVSPTRVSFSSDLTTLVPAAQNTAPANFVSYVEILTGSAQTALPAFSVTVDAGALTPGETVTVYKYNAGLWTPAQTVQVSGSGKITFLADSFSLWGIFR